MRTIERQVQVREMAAVPGRGGEGVVSTGSRRVPCHAECL